MIARRTYHVCASTAGAMGGTSTLSRVADGLTKRAAHALQKRLMRKRDPRTVYFVEWDWAK